MWKKNFTSIQRKNNAKNLSQFSERKSDSVQRSKILFGRVLFITLFQCLI